MTIGVGINFKLKNLVMVLNFKKIQDRLNTTTICTPKIRERGISRKQLVFDKEKKNDMQLPLGSTNLDCSRRSSVRSP